MSEAELQANIALYLKTNYPGVLFHSDFGSGIKLQPWQARAQKIQNGGRRAWPDMFIAEPRTLKIGETKFEDVEQDYAGLFIELKKEGTRLKKKNGEWATSHIEEQANVLETLRQKGYKAEFAVGIFEATDLIDEYLGDNNDGNVVY